MSLIKETLNEDLKNLNLNRNSAFKSPMQMLVANGNKKSVVFPINKLEKPTIDSVLNTVPLFYSPITKQLILQQDLEHNNQHQSTRSNLTAFNSCNSTNNTTNTTSKSTNTHSTAYSCRTSSNAVNKKCETRLSTDIKPNLDKEVKKLNNLNDEFTNCLKEEKKLLETQLDDFTTKSINLSQRPVDNLNENKIVNNCKILNNHLQSPVHKSSTPSSKTITNDLTNDSKLNLESDLIKSENKSAQEQKQQAPIKQQTKKDSFKCHRRTPSYIHDFHNLIKNNSSPNQTKSSSITVNSATAAIQNLTKTSLASLTSTLSSTINSTTKFNDQMNSTNSILDPKSAQLSAKQIFFNESKNEFYDLDSISDTGTVRIQKDNNHSKTSYSIDDDNIEPLNLPLPYLEKPKKLSFLTESLQSVLSKLTKSNHNNDLNSSSKPVKQADSRATTNFFQSFTQANSNESSRRNSKNLDFKADLKASTTGLIFENRPVGLQPKSKDEEQQHREQYEQMLREAKRKELKDAKQTKKDLIRKKKEEERMLNSIKVWNEILPQFEQMRNTKKVKELWNQGLPSNLRGQIWKLAIGNKLNLNEQSFNEYLSKWYDSKLDEKLDEKTIKNDERIVNLLSKCSDENISELVQDVSRTFPNLKLFQKNAPFHNILLKVLGSYVISYKPNIGYIQGMSFILGMFLLNMKQEDAFIAFANLLETSPLLMTFMNLDQRGMSSYYETFDLYFSLHLPELYSHFKQQNLSTELFMINWINTLFTKQLPLEISTKIWDLLFRDGEQTIVKTSLTLLKLYEKDLLNMDFIQAAQLLTQLNANNFTIDSQKFINTLNTFNLKPVIINKKIKCKNFYSVYEHFNNSSKINSS